MLPRMLYADNPATQMQGQFAGLDHNAVVQSGYCYDMLNMTTDRYPALTTRRGRTKVRTLAKPNGIGVRGKLCWVDGTAFFYDGVEKGQVSDGRKTFARLSTYILIWPDKYYYNTATDEFGSLEARWTGSATITSYTYDAEGAGAEVYQGNAIRGDKAFPFQAGEAVKISGASDEYNNREPIIQQILEDGKLLVLTNNALVEQEAQELTLERVIPDMEYFCEQNNRLWGCKGSDIYACYVGIPTRWRNMGTGSGDSYYTPVGSDGEFTGAASYGGYPIFFKPDAVHKMYGAKPSNFATVDSVASGVATGGSASLAVAGETLFYLNRNGVMMYAGGVPTMISGALGVEHIDEAVGGSDGRRYYLSARQGDVWTLYCYDTQTRIWTKEDHVHALAFARSEGILYMLDESGDLWAFDGGQEDGIRWMMETGDFYDGGADKAGVVRLLARLELEGGTAEALIQFDSSGKWEQAGELIRATAKTTKILPIIPRRCDHYRIRLQGTGRVTLYSLSRETRPGSMI